jgi:hypothetical protein
MRQSPVTEVLTRQGLTLTELFLAEPSLIGSNLVLSADEKENFMRKERKAFGKRITY